VPPVLTLRAVHPRTNSLAWTMSSPADPIACAMQLLSAHRPTLWNWCAP